MTTMLYFRSPMCGTTRIGLQYCTREIIAKLFVYDEDEMVIADPEGEEIADYECEETLPDILEKLYIEKKYDTFTVLDDFQIEHSDHQHSKECFVPHSHKINQNDDDDDNDNDDNDDDDIPSHCKIACEMSQRMGFRFNQLVDARKSIISEFYKPKHSWLFDSNIDFSKIIVESLLKAIKIQDSKEKLVAIQKLCKTVSSQTKLYSFDFFTLKYCQDLIEEVEYFEKTGLPISRPNSMNNYGLILDEIGLRSNMTKIRDEIVKPLLKIYYQNLEGIDSIDDHHCFVVQYAVDESGDTDLGFHYDESEFTLNVCLGKKFEGARLYFAGWLEDPSTHEENLKVEHEIGRGLLHIGKHRHGAEPIESGERFNLIMWVRSSTVRKLRAEEKQQHNHSHSHSH